MRKEIHKFPNDWDDLRRRASSIWTIMNKINIDNVPWDDTIKLAIIDDAKNIIHIAESKRLIKAPYSFSLSTP